MAVNLGAAYVDIVPSTSNLAKELKGQADPIFSDVGRRAGVSMSAGLGSTMLGSLAGLGESITDTVTKWFKRGATVGLAAVAGVAAVGLKRGLSRVLDTEDARVQLGRMGLGIGEIDTLLKAVDDTFQGTPFANPDGFNISSQLFATGVDLGRIPGVLASIADVSAHANLPLGQMGDLFTKVAAQGKVTGVELMSLGRAGVPIAQIAGALGMTVEEMQKLTSEGKFTSDMFFDAIGSVEMFQGAAQAAGDTTRGAWSNVWTAIATGFDKFLTPLFGENGHMVTMLKGVRTAIRDLFPVFEQWGEAFAAWVVPATQSAIDWLSGPFLDALNDVRDAIEGGLRWYRENSEAIGKIVDAVVPATSGVAAFAVALHAVRVAFMLLVRATPIGLILLLGTALMYAWQNSETFRNVVTGAFETIRDVVGPIVETVRGWIDGLFSGTGTGSGFIDGLRDVWDSAVVIFTEIGTFLGEQLVKWVGWFRENWDTIRGTVETVVGAIVTFLTDLGQFIADEVGKWVDWWRENWESIQQATENVVGLIRTYIEGFVSAVQAFWDRFGDGIVTVVKQAWDTVREYVSAAMEIIRGIIEVWLGIITLDWGKAWGGIQTIFSGVWSAIVASMRLWWTAISEGMKAMWGEISEAGNKLRDWFNALPGRVLSWIGEVVDKLSQKGRDFIDGLLAGMVAALLGVAAWLGNLHVRVISFVGIVIGALLQKGRDFIDGLLAGMVAALRGVATWLGNLGARLRAAIPRPLQILYQIGRAIIRGLGNGIRDEIPSVQSLVAGALRNLERATPSGMARTAANFFMGRSHDGSVVGGRSFKGLRDDEVPLILQKGQAVLTEGQQQAMLNVPTALPQSFEAAMSGAGGMDPKSFGREAARQFARTLQHENRGM